MPRNLTCLTPFRAILLLGLLSSTLCAGPVTTTEYVFTGTCVDCTGVGIGTLTLQNYTSGTLNDSYFVSFHYASKEYTLDVDSGNFDHLWGDALTNLPAELYVQVTTTSTDWFESNTDGSWCTGSKCAADWGLSSVWNVASDNSVPEPGTLSLCGTALAALLGVRRRTARVRT